MTDTSRPSRHDAHAAARKVFVKAALDEYATRQLPAPPDLWPAIRQRAARSRPRPAPRRALPWSPVGLPRPPHTRPEPERAARGPRHAFLVSANLLVTGALLVVFALALGLVLRGMATRSGGGGRRGRRAGSAPLSRNLYRQRPGADPGRPGDARGPPRPATPAHR